MENGNISLFFLSSVCFDFLDTFLAHTPHVFSYTVNVMQVLVQIIHMEHSYEGQKMISL